MCYTGRQMKMALAKVAGRMGRRGNDGTTNMFYAFCSIDFSGWCNRWRSEILEPFAKMMARLVGNEKTFLPGIAMFEQSYILAGNSGDHKTIGSDGEFANINPEYEVVKKGIKGSFGGQLVRSMKWRTCPMVITVS